MMTSRRAVAPSPRSFGRRARALARAQYTTRQIGDDFKLFALTFIGGFLFMTVYLG